LRFTKPDLPAIAADLKAIRKAVVDAAGVGAGLWLTKVDLTGAHLQPVPPSGKKQDEAETEGYRENVV
jgi:hypothetical protein